MRKVFSTARKRTQNDFILFLKTTLLFKYKIIYLKLSVHFLKLCSLENKVIYMQSFPFEGYFQPIAMLLIITLRFSLPFTMFLHNHYQFLQSPKNIPQHKCCCQHWGYLYVPCIISLGLFVTIKAITLVEIVIQLLISW